MARKRKKITLDNFMEFETGYKKIRKRKPPGEFKPRRDRKSNKRNKKRGKREQIKWEEELR